MKQRLLVAAIGVPLLIVVLAVKPTGLFSENLTEKV